MYFDQEISVTTSIMASPSNNPQNPQDPQNRRDQPGLWAAHAEYIKGAAEGRLFGFLCPFSLSMFPF